MKMHTRRIAKHFDNVDFGDCFWALLDNQPSLMIKAMAEDGNAFAVSLSGTKRIPGAHLVDPKLLGGALCFVINDAQLVPKSELNEQNFNASFSRLPEGAIAIFEDSAYLSFKMSPGSGFVDISSGKFSGPLPLKRFAVVHEWEVARLGPFGWEVEFTRCINK